VSADSVTQQRFALPALPAIQPPPPPRVPVQPVDLPGPDLMADLVHRMRPVCARAVDDDEIAAVLEANGINDRVAWRDFEVTSVFTLAAAVLHDSAADRRTGRPGAIPGPTTVAGGRPPVLDTLVRAALYLTPTVVALGAAGYTGGLPTLATKGAMVFGWAVSQALAYLGYCVLGTAGRAAAVRLLGVGFAAVASGWGLLLWLHHVPWPIGYMVGGAQFALFAGTAVALVTGTERRVLRWAVPCWLFAAMMAGTAAAAPGVRMIAVAGLGLSLAVLCLVAYRPMTARADIGAGRVSGRPAPRQVVAALGHGVVGAGQAVLFVLVVLTGLNPSRLPLDAIPLLLGVPVIELLLLWHQRRVAVGRATLHDRPAFARHLRRVSRGTVGALCLPVLIGAVLLGATAGRSRLATTVLLTAVYALGLVLATHRRLGTAALLVWWPAILIAITGPARPVWVHLGSDTAAAVSGLTLLAACLPAVAAVTLVIRDPWSYR
jgi:hypothetical protein